MQGLQHVLVGWCGAEPTLLVESRIPQDSIPSEGPNTNTLPNTISNKYIRRDGYAYQCLSECDGVTCVTDNYVEFQTEAETSNLFSMYVKVENPTDRPVENVLLTVNTQSFSTNGEYALPHNLDFPYEDGSDLKFSHGSTLGDKVVSRTVNGIPMTIDTIDAAYGPQIVFGPFDVPAYGEAGSEIELPLQDPNWEKDQAQAIPHTTGESINSIPISYNWAYANVPCECTEVKTHSVDGATCAAPVANPTLLQCQVYYQMFDAAGKICDGQCIQVPGCPPPYCFQGSSCTSGSLSACPGGAITNECLDPVYGCTNCHDQGQCVPGNRLTEADTTTLSGLFSTRSIEACPLTL